MSSFHFHCALDESQINEDGKNDIEDFINEAAHNVSIKWNIDVNPIPRFETVHKIYLVVLIFLALSLIMTYQAYESVESFLETAEHIPKY